MKTEDIKTFFDKLAPTWDAETPDRTEVIEAILDNAGVSAGQTILDVACGTGVMLPYYLKRGAASVTGIDLSDAMTDCMAR